MKHTGRDIGGATKKTYGRKNIIEENCLTTETADPLGNIAIQETDSRGNIVRVASKTKTAGG